MPTPLRLHHPRYNLFLRVPPEDRLLALSLGARFDRIAARLLVPCTLNLQTFAPWLAPRARLHQRAMFSESDYHAALAAFMKRC